jgi:hypothetical protein
MSVSPTQTQPFTNVSVGNTVAVYFGQADSETSLDQLCSDPSIDIVFLAFLTQLNGLNGWPTLNVAGHCGAASLAQINAGATGLVDCSLLATAISQCQHNGKKVLLSLGGATGDLTLPTEAITTSAQRVWDLFIDNSNDALAQVRPFGNISLDGLDIGKQRQSFSGVYSRI